ncbi:hypothetical protein ADUPG1_014519, partial [Aduncisulcus paluster]
MKKSPNPFVSPHSSRSDIIDDGGVDRRLSR